jgi:tetratricopeptide (TPR) repeat protein
MKSVKIQAVGEDMRFFLFLCIFIPLAVVETVPARAQWIPVPPDGPVLTTDENRPPSVAELQKLALAAFHRRNFINPPDDCALKYLREILALDPKNSVASAMKQELSAYYLDQAAKSEASGNPEEAVSFYQGYLKVNPGDRTITEKIVQLRKSRTGKGGSPEVIEDFNRTDKANTLEGWSAFLSLHPNSEFADYARKRIQELRMGSFSLQGLPESDSLRISLDGVTIRIAPGSRTKVEPGTHVLEVSLPPAPEFKREFRVEPGGHVVIPVTIGMDEPLYSARAFHLHRFSGKCRGELSVWRDRFQFQSTGNASHSLLVYFQAIEAVEAPNATVLKLRVRGKNKDLRYRLETGSFPPEVVQYLSGHADGQGQALQDRRGAR